MAVYVVTGKRGGGKSLLSVKRIQDKLNAGLPVATNLNLNLHKLVDKKARKTRVVRIPDKPSIEDLHSIGTGNDTYDEERNGLFVLDECGTWFNSRNWNDKARKPVNDWFLHNRKLGWDVILIIQDVSLLDSQARSAIAEHTVFCKRLDRVSIPFIGTAWKALTGYRLTLPKLHVARVVYGISLQDLIVDRWAARGDALYEAYDTKQLFLENYPHGTHSVLPPWYTHGRYAAARNWKNTMRLTRIIWRKFQSPVALGTGMLIGSSFAVASMYATNYDPNNQNNAPSIESSRPEQAHQVQVTDPGLLRLQNARIQAYWTIDERVNYRLQTRTEQSNADEPTAKTINTMDLENTGYQVTPISRCSVVVSMLEQTVPIYCF